MQSNDQCRSNDQDQERIIFHDAPHTYFRDTFHYIKNKFPLDDQLICNSVWMNFTKRSEASWTNVQYFYDKYYHIS